MFQQGTGERFKYKQAVKNKYPQARCKKYEYRFSSTQIKGYVVETMTEQLSDYKLNAEQAWADAWLKHVK